MGKRERQLPQNHQIVIDRFVAACQTDERVVAAFLGGSYAKGTSDEYSDLDLYAIVTDETYDGFFAGHKAFLQRLGDLVFLEDFQEHGFDLIVFLFADGTEGELGLGRESHFTHIHEGPISVLLDTRGCLSGVVFPWQEPVYTEQIETLRRLISWFWHDLLHHFITPLARGQLWSAYGALEELRRSCVNLARLRQNFQAAAEGYERVEQALSDEALAPLQATCCQRERGAMLHAAHLLVQFYQELAPSLAQDYGIPYSTDLAQIVSSRLELMRSVCLE
jgi:predicted nucleotidyltransferase